MGGCRCTFRSCPNNSSSQPNMHFFHYPIRDKERCEQWVQNSNNPEFLSYPDHKLRNRVVCQDHFRDHCFMNYLHDKLTKTAVPTIMKMNTGEIFDFAVNDTNKSDHVEEFEIETILPVANTSLLLNKISLHNQEVLIIFRICLLDNTFFFLL